MLKKLLIACCSLMFSWSIVAQEKLVLRTDRDYYVGGEEVWINITNVFNDSNQPSDISKVVYLEVSNEQFKPVYQTKFKLNNGVATSTVVLPDTISTGNYIIRAYTRWMQNSSSEDYTYKTISVVNPFSKNPMPQQTLAELSGKDSVEVKSSVSINNSGLDVAVNSNAYRKRNEVDLKIALLGQDGEQLKYATVSVVKSSLLYDDEYNPTQSFSTKENISGLTASTDDVGSSKKDLLMPEMKGEWVTGTITNINTGEPIVDEKMILCFVGDSPIMKFSKTDEEGRFHFEVNEYGKREMVIQPLNLDTAHIDYKVTLDPSYSQQYPESALPELAVSKEKAKDLNKAIVNMQVNTIYSAYLNQVVAEDSVEAKPSFYGNPEILVPIDNFIDLPTIEEVIRELVPFVALRKKKGDYYLKVIEAKSNIQREGNVIIMVDGVPVYDLNNVLLIKPSSLDRIEVMNLNYYLEDVDLGKLVCFYTKDGNMEGIDFDPRIFRQARDCYHSTYAYHSPDYTTDDMKMSRLADFRNCLYFGAIDFEGHVVAELKFTTGDDVGEYTVVIEGIDDKGNIHKKTTVFEVK